jgi:glutamate dehydrogenase
MTESREIRAWRDRLAELKGDKPDLAAFLGHAVKAADDQDVARYPAETLERLLATTFSHIGEREIGRADIRVWIPEGPEVDGIVVIDIYSEDMPFIVDSALAAIRALGGTVRFMSHPIVPVDKSRRPWAVLSAPGTDTRNESILTVHIDRPADETVLAALEGELATTMAAVRRTVAGWRPMLEKLRSVVVAYRAHPPKLSEPSIAEAMHFLAWMADHNFTFLGMREYRLAGEGAERHLEPVLESGLGILEDQTYRYLRQGTHYVHTTAQHLDFLASDEPVLVTKANKRATVHRRVHMDYVGIKLFDQAGEISGELRILGLFTSASLAVPHTDVPIIRRKVSEVMRRSGHDPRSHTGKALMNALDNYPRDEMFQISEDELVEFASVIATLPDRPRVRVLPRIDRFDNFVSVLVYFPRERFDSEARAKVGVYLAQRYDGRVSAFTPDFPEGDLARVHYIIGRNGGPTPRPERRELESEITELTRSFADRVLSAARDPHAVADFADAFTADYQVAHSHTDALTDIAIFKTLREADGLAVHLTRSREGPGYLTLKVYHRESAIPLSDRVPMLEHFGFKVVDERTYLIRPADGQDRYLHDMTLIAPEGVSIEPEIVSRRLEAAIVAIHRNEIENDGFNRLTILTPLGHEDVAILRALGHYLKQVGIAYSQRYIWTALASQSYLATVLVRLFHALHDPAFAGDRDAEAQGLREALEAGLDAITSIDEDRIIRRLINLIEASVRTNFYQREGDGQRRAALAIKFDAGQVEAMPAPRPYREIFVYSPRVEGVHMRGGPIARGGLRWSDRPEDFRTEVLGLLKAQMVKNAVIVPVGAKGGFVPKMMPTGADRDAVYAEGTACYKIFIGALLDITDTLEGDSVVAPRDVVRRDGDDPYLVVAADKGTARFSDTANAISVARDYWLGDAFASGGSAGYDHKQMAITARGGWVAVKRHFREIDVDIQSQDFTVVGVGDMSGDVFGNGMLLSRHIRLWAAFDHRDIFIDPDPDPTRSFDERERLFGLERSSWQDYDASAISEGGGVFSRQQKSIPLSPQIQQLLGLSQDAASPNEVITAILKAPAELMWFGGIGTYVRAEDETDAEVGDRANDAIRVSADEVRAKVIGEGANLGVTQRGRIAYALSGGRINTDAIDNSAGVNSSDLEVNIKIALADLVRSGALPMEARNALLVEMTDEVAELCLKNNYLQSLSLSLSQRRGMLDLPELADFMTALEAKGELDRRIEFLPDDIALAERAAEGRPLTRPELAVLLAYAKNTLFAELQSSAVPDDPYLAKELYRYFPETLRARYPEAVDGHRLRREVIATVLSNAMINRGGPAFVHMLTSVTSADAPTAAFAYAAARDAYGLQDLNAGVDALDTKVSGATQLALYAEIQTLQITQTLWFLRNARFEGGLSDLIARYRAGVDAIRETLWERMTPFMAQAVAEQEKAFEEGGTPPDLARKIASLSVLTLASDIILVAEKCNASVTEADEAFFAVLNLFKLGRITEQGAGIGTSDKFDRMALDRAQANLTRSLRDLASDILGTGDGPVSERIAHWQAPRAEMIARIAHTVADLTEGELTISRLSVAAGLLSDLASS